MDQNDNSTATGDSNELILTGARSIKRKLMLGDELIQPQHSKRPHSADHAGYLRTMSSSPQDNTEAWLTWRLVTDAAMARPGLIPATLLLEHQTSAGPRKLRRKIEKWVFDAVGLLTQILGKEGLEQIRALEHEYIPRDSQAAQSLPPTIPWPSLFKPPVAGDFRSLAMCLRHFSARKTALDQFGENLARAELYRTAAGMGLSLPSVESVQSSNGEEQLYVLACAFGIGILALVPSHLQFS